MRLLHAGWPYVPSCCLGLPRQARCIGAYEDIDVEKRTNLGSRLRGQGPATPTQKPTLLDCEMEAVSGPRGTASPDISLCPGLSLRTFGKQVP